MEPVLVKNGKVLEHGIAEVSDNEYKVGDLIEARFDGNYQDVEIYQTHQDNYYNIFYEDCHEEIAPIEKLRPRPPHSIENSHDGVDENVDGENDEMTTAER